MQNSTHDFFARHVFGTREELETGVIRNRSIDLWSQIRLLPLARAAEDGPNIDARSFYIEMVHGTKGTRFQESVIEPNRRLMDKLGISGLPLSDLAGLPFGSAGIQMEFTLKKPYISRDDAPFHILDNPVRKETVFKLPMISSASWKGNLRWMAGYLAIEKWLNPAAPFPSTDTEESTPPGWEEDRAALFLLFGPENDATSRYFNREISTLVGGTDDTVAGDFKRFLKRVTPSGGDNEGFRGRLHFFPTFFDAIDIEIINPHNRQTGAGELPVYIEAVPAGATGIFSLLYVPTDRMNEPCPTVFRELIKKDLSMIARALRSLMLEFGFSAKKSSGYGVVHEKLKNGFLRVKWPRPRGSQNGSGMVEKPFSNFGDLERLVGTIWGQS